ncbi:BF3164 family lipoprotein [Algoriphagus winogradskyi]|uniref:TolB-like 6-blade propeller-like n=1 Tax=Algoriphagus winogradskyi TaxID=237017 RepID=A0ABY1PCD3_9BACT|nr:BF3164 family lipoprotein [Algoriphagus winogradskyi]SMP31316.1 TolB-like 6-blade propeller-like [Algoriphagus winogradskyi]
MKRILLIILILSSCSPSPSSDKLENQNTFEVGSFGRSEKLKSQKYTYNEILTPFKIYLKGKFIIIGSQSDKRLMHLLDKSTLGYVTGKGVKGEGPGEFVNVRGIDSGFNDSTIWAYSNMGKAFYEFTLYDTLSLAKSVVVQNQKWFQAMSMNWKQSGEIISYMNFGPSKLKVFDIQGNTIDSAGLWVTNKELSEDANFILSDLHQGAKYYNKDNQVYVLSKLKFDQFEIFNFNNKKHIEVNGPFNEDTKYDVGNDGDVKFAVLDENTKYGYSDVCVTKNFIFLVFIGKTLAEGRALGETSRDIFQFDLAGRPIAHFQTDVPIISIAVDEEESKIYALTEDQNPGIAVFKY